MKGKLFAIVVAFALLLARDSQAACTYSIASTSLSVPSASGYYKVGVSTTVDCRWTATESNSFIHLHTVAGFGDGRVGFAVDANTGAARTGTILIAGHTFTVKQAGTTTPSSPVPAPPPIPNSGGTITVPSGGDLQAALDKAVSGDTIVLQAGATYRGHFVLRKKSGTAQVTIRSSASSSSLPAAGVRVTPSYASSMPKLKSTDSFPVLETDPGVPVSNYVIKTIEFEANNPQNDLIMLGHNDETQTALWQVPSNIVLDRVYVHGTSTSTSKRGVSLNGKNLSVVNSYFADFHAVGQDTQDISIFNGPGPFDIENNYVGGATENFMSGGDDPRIPGLVPSNITFRRNYVTRPMSWKTSSWQIKNLFELKSANHVDVEYNVFENHWMQAQRGVAIVFTPRNQYGRAPQTVVANVTFANNVVRNVASGIAILGHDNDHPSQQTHNITIRNNVLTIRGAALGGDGRFLNLDDGIGSGADNVVADHNTVDNDGSSSVYLSSGAYTNFEFTNNLTFGGKYGIMSSAGIGQPTITKYLPGSTILKNAIAGVSANLFPVGNDYPTVTELRTEFVDFTTGDYRLDATSRYQNFGTDGNDLGADVTTVLSKAGK